MNDPERPPEQPPPKPGIPPTRCPECTQPAPADARFCPHCRHSFALYARPPSLPPVSTGRGGWRKRKS